MQAIAGLAFREEQFTGCERLSDRSGGEQTQLARRQIGEKRYAGEYLGKIDPLIIHVGILAARDFSHCGLRVFGLSWKKNLAQRDYVQ